MGSLTTMTTMTETWNRPHHRQRFAQTKSSTLVRQEKEGVESTPVAALKSLANSTKNVRLKISTTMRLSQIVYADRTAMPTVAKDNQIQLLPTSATSTQNHRGEHVQAPEQCTMKKRRSRRAHNLHSINP
jgi:hypothetical protein